MKNTGIAINFIYSTKKFLNQNSKKFCANFNVQKRIVLAVRIKQYCHLCMYNQW